ncbi:hypothetical protein C7T94_08455 [Pedobacter yulinensis]|uniref:Carbohydrate-binding domain-containing protein n=1 Tax=Pedobacter yulinensis TaxID=2126353 RepID=A0A2T3HJR5_9SPHI|nr:carbohydrate-binding family 9-like protein [Pedobacter yulinensis]PST82682.1 hypothetical protein C7T94_08455 [Pedobacter yulinensis]
MNQLKIPYISTSDFNTPDTLLHAMQQLERQQIAINPWPEFTSDTRADFFIAHNTQAILLKYQVEERYLIANESTNGNIHNDSCVEFFIAFNDDSSYYNLEFNCLGATKIGYGSERGGRELLPAAAIGKMSFASRIHSGLFRQEEGFSWEIVLVIPNDIFIHHDIRSFDLLKARGNFYKCGDGLPQPHFLTWNRITGGAPDFHRTDCFGALEFGPRTA